MIFDIRDCQVGAKRSPYVCALLALLKRVCQRTGDGALAGAVSIYQINLFSPNLDDIVRKELSANDQSL